MAHNYKIKKTGQTMQQKPSSPEVNANLQQTVSIKEWMVYISIFLFSFILYANTFQHQWALDDGVVFKENIYVKQGTSAYGDILSTHSMHGVKIKPEAYQYRPLSLLMFATEWQLSPDNSTLYHVLNVLWYALACVLLYVVLRKMFVDKNKLLPFIITILYAAHPMHTEVVANIKGRDEIMLLLFLLSSIWFALQYIDTKKMYWLTGVFLSFLLAMFSKESAITFLLALPITVYFFRKAGRKEYINIIVAIVVPIIIYLVARFAVLSEFSSSALTSINNYFAEEPLMTRWACAIMLLGKYLLLLIIPYQQVCDYSFSQLPLVTFGSWQTMLSLLVYIALLVYAFKGIRKKSPIAFAVFFFVVTMSIYSNLVYLIGASFADRFLFLPSLAYCIAIVYLLFEFSKYDYKQQKFGDIRKYTFSMGILIVMLLFFVVKTYSRSAEWENNYTLYGADIKKSENSARLNLLWGEALRDKAIEYQAKNDTLSTPAEMEKNTLFYKAYMWKSIQAIQKAITIYPKHANAYERLGFAYYSLSPFYRKENFLDSAVKYYEQSLLLNPNSLTANYNIAIAYYNKGDYAKAKNHYVFVVNADSSEHVVHFDAGSSYAMLGMMDSARYHFNMYLQTNPDKAASCYSNLAIGYARINELDSAISMCDKTIVLEPYNTSAYQLKTQIYTFIKDFDKALATANALIALQPEHPSGYMEKSSIYNQMNRKDSAEYYYELSKSKNNIP